jgi:hypothetical protein
MSELKKIICIKGFNFELITTVIKVSKVEEDEADLVVYSTNIRCFIQLYDYPEVCAEVQKVINHTAPRRERFDKFSAYEKAEMNWFFMSVLKVGYFKDVSFDNSCKKIKSLNDEEKLIFNKLVL